MSTGQSGSAQEDPNASNSLSSLLSTLIPVAITATVMFAIFLVLRRSQRRQYAPRTYLGTLREEERSPDLPLGLTNWISAFFRIPDTFVLNHQSIDAYLFLRYLQIASITCFVGCLITWPVLFPVNATGGAGKKQLDLLSFANVVDPYRYYAHTGVSYLFFGFILFMVTRESLFYISLRQAYLLSPLYSNRMSSRTVLFTSVPDQFLDGIALRRMFGPLMKNFWVNSDCKEVEELVKERDKVAMKLEGAEVKLVKLANGARLKAAKKQGGAQSDEEAAPAAAATLHDHHAASGESGSVAARWIKQKQRPTHRLKPLIGKKVDTINWSRTELDSLIPKVEGLQASHRAGKGKHYNSVFVEFVTQTAAQDAFQALTHHQPLHMSPRYIGVTPAEVIWSNLRIKWWERIIRTIATTSFVTVMVVFFAIPVAVVGAISQIDFLIKTFPWLSFINAIPDAIKGVVTGLLPVILLSVLLALVPIVLRLMARLSGAPSLSSVELTTQNTYFAFQVIQGFLVITVAAGAVAVFEQVKEDPASATTLLATNLPKASNFYIAYFCLQGLSVSAGAVLQIVGLILFKLLGKILDSTPRKMYKRWATLSGLGWGSVFPVFVNMTIIAIVYSCIAPLVLGFASIALFLIYLAYRYNLLFVYDANIDTKGLIYPRALQQTLTGVYIGEVLLIGLFSIQAAPGPLVLEVILLIFTILYHVSLNAAIEPLLKYLPKSLQAEEDALLALENGTSPSQPANGVKSESATWTIDARTGMLTIQDIDSYGVDGKEGSDLPAVSKPPPHKKPNFITKWLRPDRFTDYHTLRRLVPRHFANIAYSPEAERDAYYHPAVNSPTPLLWIPRDSMGVSRQEVLHTSKVIPMTDEGVTLDEKNKIVWNWETQPPIHEEPSYY
ncbi:MAG: hypothetical protein M1837_007011 [Sclerophora amabilis]|nr:MAG: hypothetical protein M1837_007011 [Sclerophora amabilis]